MPNYCEQCGKTLKDDSISCPFCNYSPVHEPTEKLQIERKSEETSRYKNESFKDPKSNVEGKKESKYILSPAYRKIFLLKVLPILLAGNLIWLIGDLFFTLILTNLPFLDFVVIYILIVIVDIIMFFSLNRISQKGMSVLGIIIYFLFTFTAGIITVPIVMLGNPLAKQVHMVVFIALECAIIVCLIGISLKDKYLAKGYGLAHVFLFIIFLIIAEIIFLVVFNIKNFLLTIPISVAAICIFTLTTMFFGAIATKRIEKLPAIFIAYKIVSVYLFILIGTIILAIVVLIIIAIVIALDEAGIGFPSSGYLSHIFWGSSSSSRNMRIDEEDIYA